MRWKNQHNSLMGCHKQWLSASAKCRTLCFHSAMADITFPFLPAWDLYTLCQGCDLFITLHGYLCLTHFDLLPSRLLSTHKSPSFPIVFSVWSFNEQWTKATENNAHWSQRKLRKRLIVGATHHFNSDSSLIGWTDVSFLIPKSFFPSAAIVAIVFSHGKLVSSRLSLLFTF